MATIITKNGSGSAVPASLTQGELAINVDSGTLYYGSGSANEVRTITASLAITASYALTASYVNPLYQQVLISGSLKLDPTQDPDPSGLDLDSTAFFQSASNTALGYDLYIRQNGNIVKWKWVEGVLSSGLLYGGVVTYSGSNVFVSPGSCIIADHNATTGSEIGPIITYVQWPSITQSVANIATQQVTYLYIDQNGALQQQSTRFTPQQYHDYIPLGAVGHFDFTQVSAFGGQVQTAYDQVTQILTFVDAFGPLKISGYGITGQAGTLSISVGSGVSFIHGGFYENDPEFPSTITTSAQATASIAYVFRSGSGVYFDTNNNTFYTVVDPTKWDDGSGTLQNIPGGFYSNQRIYIDPKTGVLYVYYGTQTYNSIDNAVAGLSTDDFAEGDTFDFTTFLGILVIKSNTTDITNTSDAKILNSGLFRAGGVGGGGGGGGADALGDLSDVSISSPVDGEALIYNAGIWQNGNPTSASYALTASYALNGSVAPFPFTGSAIISGSLSVTGSVTGDVQALTIASSTASMDLSLSNFFTLTLESGSNTYLSPTNITPGQTINLRITQPATSGSLSYDSIIKFPGGIPYSASATGSVVDILSMISFDSSTLYATAIKNLS